MHKNTIKTLLLSVTLGAAMLAASQAGAQDFRTDRRLNDGYGSPAERTGARDPYTDGASATGKRDIFTDGARTATEARDPFVDGARGAIERFNLAGLDRTGVSASPAHTA